MSIRDATLSDIYVDENGKLWRCIATCGEPTVTFEEVEGRTLPPSHSMGPLSNMQAQANAYNPPPPLIIKDRKSGGLTGAIWNGWKRIYRIGEITE